MIQIVVITRQGSPAGHPASAQFGSTGGTIGRADTNTLVLDDPDRTVSRVHAQVLCREGRFFIVDRGSNPMQCNGQPLGAGREAPIADGDRLVIGSFELRVQAGEPAAATVSPAAAAMPAAASPDDPFADLLAGLAPSPAPAAMPPAGGAPAPAQPFADPMASAPADDPFADLLGAPPAAAPAAPADPLGDFSDLGAPAMGGKGTGIDELFGAGGGLGGDPLALSPLADPLLQPNTAAAADPLAALQRAAPSPPPARADHLPIGQFAYTPPRATEAPPAAEPPPAFDDMTGQPVRVAAAPRVPAPSASPVPSIPDDDDPFTGLVPAPTPAVPVPVPVSAVAPAMAPVPVAAPAPAAPAVSGDVLMAAFLRGIGSAHQPPTALTPELMERVGVMLRSTVEGTLQLLLTRQEFKREVRAEVTMIAAQANNPLKFSPTVEVALAHLLGPGVRGFMPAEAAMRDAFDDLRAHQFGVMVGMRAALAHVIARFAPDELEKKIAARSALDSLFAANRKAKLWDQFIALYGGIATEAEDDFHSLFGKAFLEAYEAQMARLKAADTEKR